MVQVIRHTDYFDSSALHLNQALVDNGLAPLMFVAADGDLLQAAQAEGLETENPTLHP